MTNKEEITEKIISEYYWEVSTKDWPFIQGWLRKKLDEAEKRGANAKISELIKEVEEHIKYWNYTDQKVSLAELKTICKLLNSKL